MLSIEETYPFYITIRVKCIPESSSHQFRRILDCQKVKPSSARFQTDNLQRGLVLNFIATSKVLQSDASES
ncbi:hypothetical protein Hanom_Chr05g00403331 [Helianthus anomalus]